MAKVSNNRNPKVLLVRQASAPTATPALAAGEVMVYARDADGKLVLVDEDDNEFELQFAEPAVVTVTSGATITPTFDKDAYENTAQAAALAFANPTGTARNMWGWLFAITDDGTPRALSFDTKYRGINDALPTTTVANKVMYIAAVYREAVDKVDVLSVVVQP